MEIRGFNNSSSIIVLQEKFTFNYELIEGKNKSIIKYSIFLCCFFLKIIIVFGGNNDSIKSKRTYLNGELVYYGKYDKNGNCYFSKQIDQNGINFDYHEYDKLNRTTQSYYVGRNGISIDEVEYIDSINKVINYKIIEPGFDSIDPVHNIFWSYRDNFNKLINIKNEIELKELPFYKEKSKQFKYIRSISTNDTVSHKRLIQFLNSNGEITESQIIDYNKNAYVKKSYSRYHSNVDQNFNTYDSLGNITSFIKTRIIGDKIDTTESYYCIYSADNKMIEKSRYSKNKFENKVQYFYNENGKCSKYIVYYSSPDTLTQYTIYNYLEKRSANFTKSYTYNNKNELIHRSEFIYNIRGHLLKDTFVKYLNGKKNLIKVKKYKYGYW
jgi:hypothetical protein